MNNRSNSIAMKIGYDPLNRNTTDMDKEKKKIKMPAFQRMIMLTIAVVYITGCGNTEKAENLSDSAENDIDQAIDIDSEEADKVPDDNTSNDSDGQNNPGGAHDESETADIENTDVAGGSDGTDVDGGSSEVLTDPGNETATDGQIDFEALESINPDIYAWIYIPDTGIDHPVLRANASDDRYTDHGADGAENTGGALYTEIYNNPDFSDFNTIIHGAASSEDDLFHELHSYEDNDFFDSHRTMYIVTPYTTLTYEVIAAYYDEGSDIMRRHDYTTYAGCNRWITEYDNHKDMSMIKVEPQVPMSVDTSFLVTLDTPVDETGRQFVVIASMTDSGVVSLERFVSDEEDYYDNIEDFD